MRVFQWSLSMDILSMHETIDIINSSLRNSESIQHIVVNAAKIVNAQKDFDLRSAINDSDIVNVDGMAVVWALRLLGHKIHERVSGIDLFDQLLELSYANKYKPYFLGATEEINKLMLSKIKSKYPGMEIAGARHGYFSAAEEILIVDKIKASKPDMLFIGISSPRKEEFINKYFDDMNIPFVMGVGGSFDVCAGSTKRAPIWMQKNGLEWLFRIYQEPKRMWKRYLRTNTIFIWMMVIEIFKNIHKKIL
jgi:N-acetylglucosaminyldiphosphoundecaprenol N-acetyl-beta-D-mannosaminyltransferase